MPVCSKCGLEIRQETAKFCPHCGYEVAKSKTCPKCKTANIPLNAKFCPTCGESLVQQTPQNPTPQEHKERKPLSTCGDSILLYGHETVDLGLSVLWSTCNVGAGNILSNGLTFSWGDPSRETITSKMANLFKSPPRDSNICGLTNKDIAMMHWGGEWQLPGCEHFLELKDNCTWNTVRYQGLHFYQVKSIVNGNYILLPVSMKLWIGDRAFGGIVNYFDTAQRQIIGESYDVDHAYYVRPIISKA